jgi:hypothetical protein
MTLRALTLRQLFASVFLLSVFSGCGPDSPPSKKVTSMTLQSTLFSTLQAKTATGLSVSIDIAKAQDFYRRNASRIHHEAGQFASGGMPDYSLQIQFDDRTLIVLSLYRNFETYSTGHGEFSLSIADADMFKEVVKQSSLTSAGK